MPKPRQQQLGIAVLVSKHTRQEEWKLIDDDEETASGIRQARETCLELIRGTVPFLPDGGSEFDANRTDIGADGQTAENIPDRV